jgi:hypothetical protein
VVWFALEYQDPPRQKDYHWQSLAPLTFPNSKRTTEPMAELIFSRSYPHLPRKNRLYTIQNEDRIQDECGKANPNTPRIKHR